MIREKFQGHLAPILIIGAVMVIGYHQIVLAGADFFTEADSLKIFRYAHGNAIGNGWHPELQLGISLFYGDPGIHHAWSIFSLLEKLLPYPIQVYNVSVITMLFCAALAQYFFLLKVCPQIDQRAAALLSTLICFGPLQWEFFFQRHWITLAAGTPMILLLLHRHFEAPSRTDPAWLGLILWATWFLGSAISFIALLMIGFLFFINYVLLKRLDFWSIVRRYLIILPWSFLVVLLLGAWVFYPIFLESRLETYVRGHSYPAYWDLITTNFIQVAGSLFGFWHNGLVSSTTLLPQALCCVGVGWTHPSIISPLVFIFLLAWKPVDSWHIIIRRMYLFLLVDEYLMHFSPAYSSLRTMLIPFYPVSKFHVPMHQLGLALLAIVVHQNEGAQTKGRKAVRTAGFLLATLYIGSLAFTVFLKMLPATFARIVAYLLVRDFPVYVANFFAEQIAHNTHWYTLLFMGLSAYLCWVFGVFLGVDHSRLRSSGVIVLLASNGILYSWSILPVNTRPSAWDGDNLAEFSKGIAPTDRFYFFGSSEPKPTSVDTFIRRWPTGPDGISLNLMGFEESPALNLSGYTAFTQQNVVDYLQQAFARKEMAMTELRYGPEVTSNRLDMAAVNYYYSNHEFYGDTTQLTLINTEPVWVYRSNGAWPYFFLAKALVPSATAILHGEMIPETAYVEPEATFEIERDPTAIVEMTKFNYGEILFDYIGSKPNFLVVADAWHPFWQAELDSTSITVVKVNDVFKGVRLPQGKHRVRLFFDTSAYQPGIYVSIAAWILISGFLLINSKPNHMRRKTWTSQS